MPKYTVGKIVKGRVTGIQPYGAFVSLDDYYSGLIHISEVSHDFVRNIDDHLKIDEIIKVKIIEIDEDHQQLKLSIKDIDYRIKTRDNKYRMKIKETPKGFKPLGDKLDFWISKALEVISEAENRGGK